MYTEIEKTLGWGGNPVSPLGSVMAPRVNMSPRALDRAPAGRPAVPEEEPSARRQPQVQQSSRSSVLSALSSQAALRQAQLLLLVASNMSASPAATPALRQIAAAAYQMEIDARREISRLRAEGMSTGRQWLA
jgi:hypothetical protein